MTDLELLQAQIAEKDAEIAKLAKEVADLKAAAPREEGPTRCPQCHAEYDKTSVTKQSEVISTMQDQITQKDADIAKLAKEVADLKAAAPAKKSQGRYPFGNRKRVARV